MIEVKYIGNCNKILSSEFRKWNYKRALNDFHPILTIKILNEDFDVSKVFNNFKPIKSRIGNYNCCGEIVWRFKNLIAN